MVDSVVSRLAKFVHELVHSRVDVDKHGDERKTAWGTDIQVPGRLKPYIRFAYDANLIIILDGPKNTKIVEDLFAELVELLVGNTTNTSQVFGDFGTTKIEIICQYVGNGKGGCIFFKETQKKGLFKPRVVEAFVEDLRKSKRTAVDIAPTPFPPIDSPPVKSLQDVDSLWDIPEINDQ